MVRRIGLTIVWLGFILYAFLAAPPDHPQTLDLILRLSRGDWREINPAIVVLLVPTPLGDDMARRGMKGRWPWAVMAVPMLGAIVYLMLRPPLPANDSALIH
ncbi:hypothetical protein XM38_037790 [Halomicronema hongdechloris C2206]|uniref:DUF2834 domain-containing protein n=1 Tax=Halomicronema hongdechloris C2206 TaxID=1641165 RepID=A0A1Z3HR78_9CYAN|nr:hypothetical protein [Halomicronema hongdechloris]ASC72820.1 hypothetical protein XM38_037790 [Halomicronema hongdechloris C2206]